MPVDPISHRFVSEQALAPSTTRTQLADAEQELAARQAQLAGAITSGDPEAAAALAAAFIPVNARIEELRLAVDAATSNEERRLQAARINEAQARVRAARAHAANFGKHIKSLQIAERDVANAYRQADEALAAAHAILGDDIDWPRFWYQDWPKAAPAPVEDRRQELIEALQSTLAGAIAAMAAALPATPVTEEEAA